MKSITPEELFSKIAMNSGISDLRTIKDIYYGMLKTITKELRGNHRVKLPDLGEFTLKIHKSRRFMNVNGGLDILPPIPTMKFSPDYKVKAYFKSLGL